MIARSKCLARLIFSPHGNLKIGFPKGGPLGRARERISRILKLTALPRRLPKYYKNREKKHSSGATYKGCRRLHQGISGRFSRRAQLPVVLAFSNIAISFMKSKFQTNASIICSSLLMIFYEIKILLKIRS